MRFGDLPLAEAEGAILAHSVRAGKLAFRKGRRLSRGRPRGARGGGRALGDRGPARARGRPRGRGRAADRGGRGRRRHLRVDKPFTGPGQPVRRAGGRGARSMRARIDRLNRIDEAVTIATLPAFAPVEPKQMVATVKIIPFGVARPLVEQLPRSRPRAGRWSGGALSRRWTSR